MSVTFYGFPRNIGPVKQEEMTSIFCTEPIFASSQIRTGDFWMEVHLSDLLFLYESAILTR